jgi:hypothetical protein
MEDFRSQRKWGDIFFSLLPLYILNRVFLETDFSGRYRFPLWFIIAKAELRQLYQCGYVEEDV